MRWNTSENPSMRFSKIGSSASGVTSRPVKPVPPVVMTTSTPDPWTSRALARAPGRSPPGRRERWGSAVGKDVPGLRDAVGERLAGFVVGHRARVGHGEHRDVERHELF